MEKEYYSKLLNLREKPSRAERRSWLFELERLYNEDVGRLYLAYVDDLDFFKKAFNIVHPRDYIKPRKYKQITSAPYKLFKKVLACQKSKSGLKEKDISVKKISEDKLTRSFISLCRKDMTSLIESLIETDIRLGNLYKLLIIIDCELYSKKLDKDVISLVKELLIYKFYGKLAEVKNRTTYLYTELNKNLDKIFPISLRGGVLNAIQFYSLIPYGDYVDLDTCGVSMSFSYSDSLYYYIDILGKGVRKKLCSRVHNLKDIILPTTSIIKIKRDYYDERHQDMGVIKFNLFCENNPTIRCGNLIINRKNFESFDSEHTTIILDFEKKRLAVIPDNMFKSINSKKILNIFKLMNHVELSALRLLENCAENTYCVDNSTKANPVEHYYSYIKSLLLK